MVIGLIPRRIFQLDDCRVKCLAARDCQPNSLADYHRDLLRSGRNQRGTRFSGESQLGLLCSFIAEKVASNYSEVNIKTTLAWPNFRPA